MPCPCGAVGAKPHHPQCAARRSGKTRQRIWQLARRAEGRCVKCGSVCEKNPDTDRPYSSCKDHRAAA